MFRRKFQRLHQTSLIVPCALVVLAAAVASPAHAQVKVEDLIGKAVPDITDAIEKPVEQAIKLFGDQKFDEARDLLKATREKNPQLPPEGVIMAQLMVGINQGMAARGELERTVLSDPKDPEPYLVFGDLAFQNRQVTESSLCFEKANELVQSYASNPTRKRDLQIRAFAGLAAVASARMLYPLEEKYLNEWIKLEPDSTAAYTRLGRAQYMQKSEASAQTAYKTFQKLYDEIDKVKDPAKKVPRAEVNMAVLYTQDDKVSNAKKLMELAMSRATPDDVNTRLAVSQWALENGELELAKTAAAAALKADPDSLQGLLLMGITARYNKDYPNAETFFRKALAKAPSNFAAMNNLSIAMIDQPDEAKRRQALEYAQLNQRVNQDLNTPAGRESGATLAWVLFRMGQEADAEAAAIRVLQSGSISNEAAYYLAKILSDRGRSKEAKQILEPLIKQPRFFPGKDEAKDVLARLADQGDLLP